MHVWIRKGRFVSTVMNSQVCLSSTTGFYPKKSFVLLRKKKLRLNSWILTSKESKIYVYSISLRRVSQYSVKKLKCESVVVEQKPDSILIGIISINLPRNEFTVFSECLRHFCFSSFFPMFSPLIKCIYLSLKEKNIIKRTATGTQNKQTLGNGFAELWNCIGRLYVNQVTITGVT